MKKSYLSLSPLVLHKEMPRPIDWPSVFGRSAPLELEIGCGNGEHMVRRARERPDLNLLGLDREWLAVRRALRRLGRAGPPPHARLVQVGAGLALERLFAERSLAQAVCYFPHPWPLDKHAHRRLFSGQMLALLNNRLADGGGLRLVTDHLPFLEWVLQESRDAGFQAASRQVAPGLDTKYERKWLAGGQELFHELRLTKAEHLPAGQAGELELHYQWLDDLRPELLGPCRVTDADGDLGVFVKDFLYDPGRRRALVRAVALEDGLKQAFYIEILPRDHRWLVRPAPGCGVLPTVGVQRALEVVRDLAAGLIAPDSVPE